MYCSTVDINAAIPADDLVELTDDSHLGIADQVVIDQAIADAGELVDGFLRGRYTVPLDPVPGLLKTVATDITVWRIYSRRVRLTLPEAIDARYKNALKLLDQIQAGKISLGTGTPDTAVTSTAGAEYSGSERVFTRETMRGY